MNNTERNSILNKIRSQIPDDSYNEIKLYAVTLQKERINKLIKSKNFILAFKCAENIDFDELRTLCIKNILKGTKKYIQEVFDKNEYSEHKLKIEEILDKYPQKYKDETWQYYSCLEKIYLELKKFDFQEADNIYQKNNNIVNKNLFYDSKSKAVQTYFEKYCNISINKEQALALANFSQNVLVTARAGSGKTRTIACKAILAIEKENIKPDEILLLSFNRNAAEEMQTRIVDEFNYNKFDKKCARTFHALAHDIVQPQEELIYDDGDKDVKQKLTQFVDKIYSSKEILTDDFKNNLYEFYRWTPDDNKDDYTKYWVFKSDEEKYAYLRAKKKVTLNREKVKSNGEKWIADFLFEHGIKYKYEKLFTCDKFREDFYSNDVSRMYHPDFTIWNQDNKTTYIIEHWGIDENDSNKVVPKEWPKSWEEYHIEMHWKRMLARKHNIKLIETSICDLKEGRKSFENTLKERLESFGIVCNKLTKEEIFNRIDDNYINEMSKKFSRFILYAQKTKFTPEDIDKKLKDNIFKGNLRCEYFVKMANEIYKKYQDELINQRKTDFDHVLFRATEKIVNSNGNCEISLSNKRQKIKNLKMILIDEYQDFSQLFFDMIDAIRTFNPGIKLFCVGDDWQAINTFAGSDLKFFKEFNNLFPNSDYTNLSCNYRSFKNIVGAGNQIMLGEGTPSQHINDNMGKIEVHYIDDVNIYKNSTKELDLDYIYNKSIKNDSQFFNINHRYFKKCIEIIKKNPEQSYFIMHRETNLCHYYELEYFSDKIKNHFPNVKITANTVHKFKGMEADNIIILEATNNNFPLIHPDSEFDLIFNRTAQMVLNDEKRLFYVALTRAKNNVFILTDRSKESEYLSYIKDFVNNKEKTQENELRKILQESNYHY